MHTLLLLAVLSASKSGHLPINGVDYYYEVRGAPSAATPVLLLHGGLGSIEMFSPALPELAAGRQVIAVELQGHGRTALGKRPFKLESMGDDMAELVKRLGFEKVDAVGYSLGGGVAARFALQHPERVRKLVLISTAFSDDGYYAEIKAQQKGVTAAAVEQMKATPMYESYARLAPKNEFGRLLDTLGTFMQQKYDWSQDMKKLQGRPVMLVYADSDMFRPEHMVQFYQLLGGGLRDPGWMREKQSSARLAILPDATHYDVALNPKLAPTLITFLDAKPAA
jgi:pimeloyl-ACP methyl ester carboxylesterase